MHPRRDDDTLASSYFLIVAAKCCHDEQIAGVASNRFTKLATLHSLLCLWVLLKFVEVALQVTEGVWVRVREVNSIIVVLELRAKS